MSGARRQRVPCELELLLLNCHSRNLRRRITHVELTRADHTPAEPCKMLISLLNFLPSKCPNRWTLAGEVLRARSNSDMPPLLLNTFSEC